MRVGGVEETITVTGATPVVDVQTVQQQRVMSKEVIDTLPTGRTTTNMAVLIPGMVLSTTFSGESQDVGGNTGDVMQALSIHGGRGGDLRRMVDGLSMQSFGSNSSAFAPNSGMIQEVAVDVAAGSAEQSTGGVRVNIIPREGGNEFSGSFFATGTGDALQSDNIDQELRDRGLISASKVKSNWEVNPTFGGPIIRDRLWFFTSGRVQEVNNYIGGALRNANAGDPNSFIYAADPDLPRVAGLGVEQRQWPPHLAGQSEEQAQCVHGRAGALQLHRHAGADVARVVGELRVPLEAPGHADLHRPALQPHPRSTRASPTSPRTGATSSPTGGNDATALIGVNDLASGVFYRGPRGYFGTSMRFRSELMDNSWRAAVSYITGAHALKMGYQDHVGRMHNFFHEPVAGNLSYTFNAGLPVQLTQRSAYEAQTHVHDGGIFLQDRWTMGRLRRTSACATTSIAPATRPRRWDPTPPPPIAT